MPITTSCSCGATYELKDEFAGRLLQCTRCQSHFSAIPYAAPVPLPQAHPVFERDWFLLRQKLASLNQKYTVSDEHGHPLVYVERPTFVVRQFVAAIGGLLSAFAIIGAAMVLANAIDAGSGARSGDRTMVILFGGILIGLIVGVVVSVILIPKRHVSFYTGSEKSEKLLEVLQDRKWQPLTYTYTLRDSQGNVLALFHRSRFWSFLRTRWRILSPDGRTLLCRAIEDSLILAIGRRMLGPLWRMMLRTNFIFTAGHTEQKIGEFNRKFTIIDRYVLDLSGDPGRLLDRRIALAMGVMLDTGENR